MVNWGILGAGNIAHRFARSLAHVEGARLVAISCRSQEKADAFAAEFDVDPSRAYAGSNAHHELLADDTVDIIYLALPHSLHFEWASAALNAGKHILCEKPAMLTADEMKQVAAFAREKKLLFMEAMKPRFVALYQPVMDAIANLGTIEHVEATLCNDMAAYVEQAGTYHVQPGPGAGVLLDCGTYCASWLEALLPGTITLTSINGATKNGIDYYADARYTNGSLSARLECAFERGKPRTCTIVGSKGRIVVDELHRPQHATIYGQDGSVQELDMPYEVDDFYGEVSHATRLVEQGISESPIMSLDASIRCAQILDAARGAFEVTPAALDTLAQQEQLLRYPQQFGSAEALELGCAIARLAPEYDRGITAVITRESDGCLLFAWSTDDKAPRNYDFAEGKRQASLASGHASVWGYLEHELSAPDEPLFTEQTVGMPCAGAFPIFVGDERVATVCVSGLHEGRDHEIVVRALQQVLGVAAPALPCIVV